MPFLSRAFSLTSSQAGTVRNALHQNTHAVVMMTKQTSQASVRLVTTGISAGAFLQVSDVSDVSEMLLFSWENLHVFF